MPRRIEEETAEFIASSGDNVDEITLKTADGIQLHGWLVDNSEGEDTNLLIYFGGNAEEVSYLIERVKRYKGWTVVLMNYRGYGLSEGKPGEKELFSDALEIYDYFSEKLDYNISSKVVMGRSLGTGVAVNTALQREVDGTILISPFDRLVNIARTMFPIFPLELIIKHRFESADKAPEINSSVHIITGSEDKLVPPEYSKKLADKWGGGVEMREIEGEDHNSISDTQEYWDIIHNFLENYE